MFRTSTTCFRLFLRLADACDNPFAYAHFQYAGSAYNRKTFGGPAFATSYKPVTWTTRVFGLVCPLSVYSQHVKHLPSGSGEILNRILSVAPGCTLAGDIDVTYGKPRLLHEKTWHINFALLRDYATLGKKTNCTACQFCPWITATIDERRIFMNFHAEANGLLWKRRFGSRL